MVSESKDTDLSDELIGSSTPVYTFFGHSCSTGEVLRVPDGCMLVTLAICGLPTYSDEISKKFDELFSGLYGLLLLDPITNKDAIEDYLGVPRNTLNINHPEAEHEPNKYYMNTFYRAELMHDNQPVSYHTSGLYKFIQLVQSYDDASGILNDLSYSVFDNLIDNMYDDKVIHPKKEVLKTTVKQLQGHKLLNSDIINHLGTKFAITQRELFETNPGIYYLVSCRIPCGESEETKAAIVRRRRESRPWLTNEQIRANENKYKSVQTHFEKHEHNIKNIREGARKKFIESVRKEYEEASDGSAPALGGAGAAYRGAAGNANEGSRGAGGAGASAAASYGGSGGRRCRTRNRRKRSTKRNHKK